MWWYFIILILLKPIWGENNGSEGDPVIRGSKENKLPSMTQTIVLCNKEHESHRCAHVETQLEKLMIPYEVQSHTWSTHLLPDMYQKYHLDPASLTRREASLFLNHMLAYENVRSNYKEGKFLFLESDVILCQNFTSHIDNLSVEWERRSLEIDAIFLGNCQKRIVESKSNDYLHLVPSSRCTDSIIWSYNGIIRFLDFFHNQTLINKPIDHFTNKFVEAVLPPRIYWSKPSLVTQGTETGIFKSHLREGNKIITGE